MIRIAAGLLALAFMAAPASAYPSWWRGTLPDCAAPSVLAKVRAKVAYGAPRVLGYHLAIEGIDGIYQDDVDEKTNYLVVGGEGPAATPRLTRRAPAAGASDNVPAAGSNEQATPACARPA